ncbi:hypothetical protein [Roseisalinus antarcticus]|uniref:Sulfotransferase domain protein n=1 Tax=Roseisalinus antarcticus TaxID=254357 RepID=A0A1Y5TVH4_9RHOB|nr:hypothetical protein [Roseisalinus antarcticus]SLN69120.1 hypothetical protein ROA7023_03357 [Roseisalinus antarcticus]
MTRIVLHIGMNKTGSTAIQSFFLDNAAALGRQGVLYPETGRGRFRQHLELARALGFDLGGRPAPETGPEALRRALDAEIARAGADLVVLSSENFSRRRDPARVAAFFAGHDVRILVYVRRHDDWWASRYAQAVQMVTNPPWDPGFVAYWEHERKRPGLHQSYRGMLESWAGAFGHDALVVRPYEPAQMSPDLVSDMLAAIGAGPGVRGLHGGDVWHNRSLSAEGLAEIDAIQRSRAPGPLRQKRIRAAVDRDAGRAGGLRGAAMIPPDLRWRMVAENLDDYAHIARHHLGRADGRLFMAPLPDREHPP